MTEPSREPQSPADPDAQGLPAHIQLPDADEYRRDQLLIQMLINGFFLAVLVFWSLFIASSQSQSVAWISTGVAALIVVLSVVRWRMARAVCLKKDAAVKESNSSSTTNSP